jgi:hypothetical protein
MTVMLNSSAPTMTSPVRQPFVDGVKSVSTLILRTKKVLIPQFRGLHLLRYLMDSWFGAVLGGGVYGAWAVWANWAQGASMALTIGAAHWLTSALLTFFGTMAMRRFYGNAQGWAGSLRAFAGGLGLTYVSLFVVHGLLGTEQLLLTLAPGIIPNILFCGSYALLLKRTRTGVTA